MPFFRCAAAFLLIAAAVLLTGALNSQPASPTPPPPKPGVAAAATEVLDAALDRLDPRRVDRLETKVWQRGRLGRFTYESEGHYLNGPGHRLHLELQTRHGRAAATIFTVSDGVTLWQGRRIGNEPWTDLVRVDLKHVLQSLQSAGAPSQVREEFLHGQAFGGVVPLLHVLRSRLVWSRKETVRRGGQAFVKLSGSWSKDAARAFAPPDQLWPDGLPRQCRLYLDVQSLWPHRVEWWGPDSPGSANVLLLQMEFRDPVINQPLAAERLAREFAFPIAPDQAFNQTPEVIQRLQARARELLAQQTPPR